MVGLLRESLDCVREAGRREEGEWVRLETDCVEELALGFCASSGGWFAVIGSGRRCDRRFENRFRRTEEVEVVLGTWESEAGAM